MSAAKSLSEMGPVLVANRGEIAVRVLRTVADLGLEGVAVFTDPDVGAPHARAADIAVRIESYLDPAAVIEAARRAGARAIHPGYGFLSESPRLAAAALEAGLTWVGPPVEAIELMGDKGRSKELARDAGVPVVPGTGGDEADLDEIAALGAERGYPLVVKALAGGGGKGMRVVRAEGELEASVAAARREAEAAFGDGRVLAERYLERPRHIEVQVLADTAGDAVALGERECSLQRRHQKVIEEAPSPLVDEGMRERMGQAAVSLAKACGYEGAGTVEFIVPEDGGEFYFLEMNTRLQVEHPVTELVWGLDLVEQQLRIAAGEPLSGAVRDAQPSGHAVEARLYAENPAAGFLPATGTVRRWREPSGSGIRVDAGVAEGSVVGTDYDPMLAKVVAHGPDRETAIGRLDRALAGLELLGVANNAAFSRALLANEDVRAGRLDTGLLERELGELDLAPPEHLWAAAAAAMHASDTSGSNLPPGPWRRRFEGFGEIAIRDGMLGSEGSLSGPIAYEDLGDGRLLVEVDGLARTYAVAGDGEGDTVWVGWGGHHLEARVERRLQAGADAGGGSLEAPMPGKVLSIEVANGDRVDEGDVLMVLESMKMELQITAPAAGVVEGLGVSVGERVGQGETLVAVVEPDEGGGSE